MNVFTAIADMKSFTEALRREGRTIGFVPTMGFLHEGHLSLMRWARQENDIVVVSIFVNPSQFGPHEDLDRYPRDVAGDTKKCAAAGVDILFMPEAGEMYPEKPVVFVTVEGLSDILEGAVRPGHFRGVATVVAKLFNIVKPHTAYFGQKDFQQCAVVKRMAKDLNMDVDIIVLPTVREQDGLALSSRNTYLNPGERLAAASVSRALFVARDLIRANERDIEAIKQKMQSVLIGEPGLEIDYIEFADPDSLAPLRAVQDKNVLLVAVRLGNTRLIDNLLIV